MSCCCCQGKEEMDASITNATAQSSLCTEQESVDAVCRIQAMEMKARRSRSQV